MGAPVDVTASLAAPTAVPETTATSAYASPNTNVIVRPGSPSGTLLSMPIRRHTSLPFSKLDRELATGAAEQIQLLEVIAEKGGK